MANKRFFLILLAILLLAFPLDGHAKEAEHPDTLVIYDSLGKESQNKDNVETLMRMLASAGKTVKLASIREKFDLNVYQHIIVLKNKPDALPEQISAALEQAETPIMLVGENPPEWFSNRMHLTTHDVQDVSLGLKNAEGRELTPFLVKEATIITDFQGEKIGSLHTDEFSNQAFAVKQGQDIYTSFFWKGTPSELAFLDVVQKFYGLKVSRAQFVVIRDVNPFVDFERVKKTADAFYEAGIPFVISAGPVFENTKLPAAKNYANLLKYVETRGGRMVLNVPVVTYGDSPQGELTSVMKTAIRFFAENEVAPLGVSAENYWLRDQVYQTEGLSPFSAGIFFPDERVIFTKETNQTVALDSAPYYIDGSDYEGMLDTLSEKRSFPVDIAIGFSLFKTDHALKEAVKWLKMLSLNDFADVDRKVTTSEDQIIAENGYITIDGAALDPNMQEDKLASASKQKEAASLTGFFSVQSKVFSVIISITLFVFVVLFIFGYQMYRRKYMK